MLNDDYDDEDDGMIYMCNKLLNFQPVDNMSAV